MESFHRAHNVGGIFTDENPCPVPIETIEYYLQILYPALKFSLILQRTTSTIADVLPAFNLMISKWEKMIELSELGSRYKFLCRLLIEAFNKKFAIEINCPIYNVASLLNVAKMDIWLNRLDCRNIKELALPNINAVCDLFIYENIELITRKESATLTRKDSMDEFFEEDDTLGPTFIGIIPENS
jgi:hypothetical protein